MSTITPVRLQILLHCYINSKKFVPSTNYDEESLKWLEEQELIDHKQFVTAKAIAYVKHLVHQPFPIKTWIIPKGE